VPVSQLFIQKHPLALSQQKAKVAFEKLERSNNFPLVFQPYSGYWLMHLFAPPPHTSLLMPTNEAGEHVYLHAMPRIGTASVLTVINLSELQVTIGNVSLPSLRSLHC